MQDSNTFDPNQSTPPTPANPPAAQPAEDNTPAHFQLGAMLPATLNVSVPAHDLQFDQQKFLRLLAGSISLSKLEKKRIIDSIPKLKIEQINELINIFEEEKQKFSQLSSKHLPQLEKLAKQHHQEWVDLETESKADQKKAQDTAQADQIRKSLGL